MGIIRVILCLIFPPLAVLDKGCGSILLVTILTTLGWIPGVLAALVISSQQRLKLVAVGPNGELCEVAQKSGGGVGTLVVAIILFAIIVSMVTSNRDMLQTKKKDGAAPPVAPSAGQKVGAQKAADPPAVAPLPPSRTVPGPEREAPPPHKDLPEPSSFAGIALPATVVATEQISMLNGAGKETVVPIGSVIQITKRSDKGTLTLQINGALFVGHESRLLGKTKQR